MEKKTLSETLNAESSTFKHFTVKQVFPREPYGLKMHKDVLYQTKPWNIDGFGEWKLLTNFQMSQKMAMDTEELARRSAIYASLADSMVASVISELSPKDERTKLLKEKLAVIQEAQVAAISSGFAAASSLQLLRRDALLKNFGFQPQALSVVRTAPFEGSHVVGPDPKVLQQRVRIIRQADRMSGSSVTFQKTTKEATTSQVTKKTPKVKTQQARTFVFDRLGSTSQPTIQRTITQDSQSFRAGPAREAIDVPMCPTVASLLEQPRLHQQADVDVTQVGARLAGFAPQWRCLLGTCRATNTVEEGVGLNFQHQLQLTHHSIVFRTRNSRQDLQQAVDALLSKGAIERVLNETSLGFYSRLFLVPKKTGGSAFLCLH